MTQKGRWVIRAVVLVMIGLIHTLRHRGRLKGNPLIRRIGANSARICPELQEWTKYSPVFRLSGGSKEEVGLNDYDKWDKIETTSAEGENTHRSAYDAPSELVTPPEESLKMVQGNWTTSWKGIDEYPCVLGREVKWGATSDGKGIREVSGIYWDEIRSTLYLNGWLLDRSLSNHSHLLWTIKDKEHELNDYLYWIRVDKPLPDKILQTNFRAPPS
ncbi:hypothetical protein AAMO2058_000432600 [Amorphochlora amoebiformis]